MREESNSRALVVTGEGREGDGVFLGILGRRRVTPRWSDDPVWRQDVRRRLGRRCIGWQEVMLGQVQYLYVIVSDGV